MGAPPYSSLPYRTVAPPSVPRRKRSSTERAFDCGRCFNRYSRLMQFRYRLARHFVPTDRPLIRWIPRFREPCVYPRVDFGMVWPIRENGGRIFSLIKAALVYVRFSVWPYLNSGVSLTLSLTQNPRIENSNWIWFVYIFRLSRVSYGWIIERMTAAIVSELIFLVWLFFYLFSCIFT